MTIKQIRNENILIFFMLIFVFQRFLEGVFPFASYIDELPTLIAIIIVLIKLFKDGRLRISKESRKNAILLVCFVTAGLMGNFLYRYQNIDIVVVDLFTNVKFFLTIYLFVNFFYVDIRKFKQVPRVAKFLSLFIFFLFIVERFTDFFPCSEYRYGIKPAVLFFGHPTYLAGCCAFLISVLAFYDLNKNIWFIVINLIIMVFTLRSKSVAAVFAFLFLFIVVYKMHSKFKLWQILVLAIIAIGVAWNQIYFYFILLDERSARAVMLTTSFRVMQDYFPFGTGFGTYGSHGASVNYSKVYEIYGFDSIYELRNSTEGTFFDDHFWPIIFGQTGVIGTIFYLISLAFYFLRVQKLRVYNLKSYFTSLYIFAFLLISSTAEPAFNNSISVPLAMMLGLILNRHNRNYASVNSSEKQ